MVTTNQLAATVGQLLWSTSTIAHLCTPGTDMGAKREEPEGGTTMLSFPTEKRCVWVLEKVLWQCNKCDSGRLEEVAAASMNSAHRWLVSGHSLLAEQQQAGVAVQVSGQPCLGVQCLPQSGEAPINVG